MSLKKVAQRRLSLLAGSSLVAASLNIFVLAGGVLVPELAHAYDECVPATLPPGTLSDGVNGVSDPTLNGGTADSFSCSSATYANGITYTAAGALTVTKTSTTAMSVTANGINLTGTGTDSVTYSSTAGLLTGGAGTAGPVIDVSTQAGSITINTAGVTANQASATHAVRARSTGGGHVAITTSGALNNNSTGSVAALEAVTNGGNISISTSGGINSARQGIFAQTSGSGAVTINTGSSVTSSTTTGIGAMDITTESGAVVININGGVVDGGVGPAIRVTSGGGATVNVQSGALGLNNGSGNASVDFSAVTAGGVSLNFFGATSAVNGRWYATDASMLSGQNDTVSMSGIGENRMAQGASIDFGAGADTFVVDGLLIAATETALDFGADADLLQVNGRAALAQSALDFGEGIDAFDFTGLLMVEEVALIDLESFNNAGVIFFGLGMVRNQGQQLVPSFAGTDGAADDVLTMNSGTYIASGDARLVMDVFIGGEQQAGCDTIVAGDCFDLRGASTSGATLVTVNNIAPPPTFGGFSPVGVTIVDVGGGGASAAEHFTLDPNSPGYIIDPILGGAIDRPGLFRFALQYDADNQRHVLVGLPRSEVLEYLALSSAVQSVWHMTADTVTGRQTDLRAGGEGALWVRASGEYTKRDVDTTLESVGGLFDVDNSYKLYSGTVMVGVDLVQGRSGSYDYVAGFQAGYVSSSLDYSASPSSGRFTGGTGGLYASAWSDYLFVDGVFNINGLALDFSSPGLRSKTTTFVNTVGARLDAGLRWKLTERTFIEPLATFVWARTSFEEISLNGGEVLPADTNSRRGAIGARIGGDLTEGLVNLGYFVAGRAWNEFAGESNGVVNNPGEDLPFADEFSGSFGEAEAGVSLFNDDGTLSGFLTSGVKFKDGYSAVDLSLGLRLTW